ncbi:LOW QUALITY PROTEIN: hypothetical protein CRUP_030183 [Coryphaenoides rupestris]|nr:LOW QUALITY PROTEIN: hypothetical protein CRUP_030183 [Coryphaenoides rupestris]
MCYEYRPHNRHLDQPSSPPKVITYPLKPPQSFVEVGALVVVLELAVLVDRAAIRAQEEEKRTSCVQTCRPGTAVESEARHLKRCSHAPPDTEAERQVYAAALAGNAGTPSTDPDTSPGAVILMSSPSLLVSYSFSMSYSTQGFAHFWACSICSGVRHRSKRMPLMSKMSSPSLLVSYSFSMSYSTQGFAHFWACSICSGAQVEADALDVEGSWGCMLRSTVEYSGSASLRYIRLSSSLFSSFSTTICWMRGLYIS